MGILPSFRNPCFIIPWIRLPLFRNFPMVHFKTTAKFSKSMDFFKTLEHIDQVNGPWDCVAWEERLPFAEKISAFTMFDFGNFALNCKDRLLSKFFSLIWNKTKCLYWQRSSFMLRVKFGNNFTLCSGQQQVDDNIQVISVFQTKLTMHL